MSPNDLTVLVAHPDAARFDEFRRRWHEDSFALLPHDGVRIAFAWIEAPARLESQIAEHRPDIVVVHGSLLGEVPAHALMWVLTQGVSGVLITDDSDPSRHFQTKRCHVLPVGGTPEALATALAAEVRRVRQERVAGG